MTLIARIDRIKDKFNQLKEQDKELTIVGASNHKYQLNPCLKEFTIQEFETKHNITLPLDYRLFLTQIGNGGAGPSYGVTRLENSVDANLAVSFKHKIPWLPFEGNEFEKLYGSKNNFIKQIYGSHRVYDELVGEYTTEREEKAIYGGTLIICGEGCGHFLVLVVNGDEKGHVWADSMVSDYGVFPQGYSRNSLGNNLQFTERISFLEWYELWLDMSLQKLMQKV